MCKTNYCLIKTFILIADLVSDVGTYVLKLLVAYVLFLLSTSTG